MEDLINLIEYFLRNLRDDPNEIPTPEFYCIVKEVASGLFDKLQDLKSKTLEIPNTNTLDDTWCWHRWMESKQWTPKKWKDIKKYKDHPESFAILIEWAPSDKYRPTKRE